MKIVITCLTMIPDRNSDAAAVGYILDQLGGPSKVARDLGVPIQTAHSWKSKGTIPRWRRASVLQLAIAKGAELSADALAYLGARVAPDVVADEARAA
jgi:hypothetical protein